jgi:TMEM175 potassium channel family protein
MDRSRLEAFSDGVFAVAITLLALNLAVAGPGHGSLLDKLGRQWPAFVAYVISFFTIGIIWVNHHALVRNIAVVDRTLLFVNLLLLLFVVAIPFGTATMADYLTAGGQDARAAMALYAAILEGMSLGFVAIFEWTLHDGRTFQPVPRAGRWAVRGRFYVGQVPYLIAFAVAFISPPVSLAIIGLVAVYYIFERTPSAPGSRPGTAPGGAANTRPHGSGGGPDQPRG